MIGSCHEILLVADDQTFQFQIIRVCVQHRFQLLRQCAELGTIGWILHPAAPHRSVPARYNRVGGHQRHLPATGRTTHVEPRSRDVNVSAII